MYYLSLCMLFTLTKIYNACNGKHSIFHRVRTRLKRQQRGAQTLDEDPQEYKALKGNAAWQYVLYAAD